MLIKLFVAFSMNYGADPKKNQILKISFTYLYEGKFSLHVTE